jgi:NTE family protein
MTRPSSIRVQGPALVLSGGGVRGAYEVGVVAGILDSLGPRYRSPFRIFAGTSVGAINSAFFAANAHRADLGVNELRKLWDLDISKFLRIEPLGLFESPRRIADKMLRLLGKTPGERGLGRSLLNAGPLEGLVKNGIDFAQLHQNIDGGEFSALAIAALEIGSGRTTIFVEHGSDTLFRASVDTRRVPRSERITADHVLGSCALPMLYPARRVGQEYYVDGGIRFNTPIAPAIRAGADRIVIVAPSSPPPIAPVDSVLTGTSDHTQDYPSLPFLLGKLLNALLLDPLTYDLKVLERFNSLFDVLDRTLEPDVMAQVQELLLDTRGASYRKIDSLVFRPSQDMSEMAALYVANELDGSSLGPMTRWLLGKASRARVAAGSDLASYLLFDGKFIGRLIDLGYKDALGRADEIRTFFE